MVIYMEKKIKERSISEKRALINRLNKIEGQVKGVTQMIENNRYCNEILIQISAIDKSLKSLAVEVLRNHLSTCVVENIKNNKLEIIDEVVDLIKKLD